MNEIDGVACGTPGCDNRGKPGLNLVGYGSFATKSGRRQRYRCTVCRGTLSTNTGTAYSGLRCTRREFDHVASLRVEGVSISATARVTGHSRNTVARWLERASTAARHFNDRMVRDFDLIELQADELCTFVGNKNTTVWLFATIEVSSRLWAGSVLGRRSDRNARAVISDVIGVVAQIKCEVERDPDETGGMKSRVHPKYKTKYRVRNWASYERALIGRGNITIWLSRAAIAAWKPEGTRTRGAPPKYSDLAIETALTLRLLVHLPLRQAEGFLTSLFHLMGLDLRSPDHTTLSRRGQHLNLTLRRVPRRAALHLFIDSTGLSMVGEGEWAAAKHGRRGRRGWKKLHLGVDQAGVIVAQALTDSAVDDASTGLDLIETIASSARTVTADTAYDTLAFYETANTRGTTVVVPPAKTATLSRRNPRSSARDGTIRRISKIGRRRWKKEVGYHRQARVENAFFRYKSILGDRLRSRTRAAQAVESVLACNVLNRMTGLGRPESCAIDR